MTGIAIAVLGAAGQQGGPAAGSFQVVIAPSAILSVSKTGGPAAATVTGGTGPFTYQWSFKSGGVGIKIDTPTANSTTFSTLQSSEREGHVICSVTDTATNQIVVSNEAFVLLVSGDGGR